MIAPAHRYARPLAFAAVLVCVAACQDKRDRGALPSRADLRAYDFTGSTAGQVEQLCQGAARLEPTSAARALLRCGRVLLHWYLSATLREDKDSLARLGRLAGADGKPHQVGRQILKHIEERLDASRRVLRRGSLARQATAGAKLARLQRELSVKWNPEYLRGIAWAARSGAPFEIAGRVIVAGAAIDGLRAAAKAGRDRRNRILIRGLGFACPEDAITPDEPGDHTATSCPRACPRVREAVRRLPPARRKGLIAAKCPPSYFGFSHRSHGVYLARESHLLARAVTYLLANLRRLRAEGDHPLVKRISAPLARLRRQLSGLRLALPLPDMSPGEAGFISVPLCASANERLRSGVYLALSETRLLGGPVPVLGVHAGRVEIFDHLEGYTFPGREVPASDASVLQVALNRLTAAWRRISAGVLKHRAHTVAIYADAKVSVGRLNDLLDLLIQAGIRRAELVFRNAFGDLRAVGVDLAKRRRSPGPALDAKGAAKPAPEPKAAQKPPPTPKQKRKRKTWRSKSTALQLTLNHVHLRLTADDGPLKKEPLVARPNDLAGLRERLEKTRLAYRNVQTIAVRVSGDVRYLEVARLLHTIRRNSSGRALYTKLIL